MTDSKSKHKFSHPGRQVQALKQLCDNTDKKDDIFAINYKNCFVSLAEIIAAKLQ